MKVKIIIMSLLMVVIAMQSAVAFDKSFPFKCSECHSSPAEVLKDSHEKIEKFTSCFDCHEPASEAKTLGERVHSRHFDDMGISKDTCLSCHDTDDEGNIYIVHNDEIYFGPDEIEGLVDKFKTWNDSPELANSHKLSGVYCSNCHDRYDFDDVDFMSKKCKGCHGEFKDVAEFTSDLERNPHKSHFARLSCVKCHNVHEPFQDYCDKCHHTNMKWSKRIK